MGFRLGFTFLMLNPIPYCMKIKPSNISPVTESEIFKVSYVEDIRLRNRIDDIENNTSESNAEFDQIESHLGRIDTRFHSIEKLVNEAKCCTLKSNDKQI